MNKQQYVCGFLLNKDLETVLLIEKNRPDYMAGKCTGLGGKIEEGETPLQAMVREFREEGGLYIDTWKGFLTILGETHDIHYFYTLVDDINNAKQIEDEILVPCNINSLFSLSNSCKTMPNVKWVLQMILSMANGEERHKYFEMKV